MRRKRSSAPDGDGGPRKRPRIVHEAPTFEEITSPRQLMQLLAFSQDLQQARHGLQSFKLLLDRLNDPDKQTPEDVDILHKYLEHTRPRDDDGDGMHDGDGDGDGDGESQAVHLSDVMDTWSFGAKMENDNIMSAVPVVLALLLKYLSHVLELRALGIGLCRTLLQPRQLELVSKNLHAEKSKEFVISPTLRMLREAISFDGGAVAKPLFRARRQTYRSLARNMSIRFLGDGIEDPKRTSARTNGIRFFLASLQFLHPEAKAELLGQREVVSALTKTIKDDPPYVVRDVLDTLRNHVVRDARLKTWAKAKILNAATLVHIAGLYSYAHDGGAGSEEDGGGQAKPKPLVSDAAHQFLLDVCTSPSAGVLLDQHGCYPRGVEPDATVVAALALSGAEQTEDDDADDADDGDTLGLDRIAWMDRFVAEVPVHNLVLSELIASLRPWSSTRQSALLMAIFREAPELIAWYFVSKKSFSLEPKISATWVGFAALLFNAVQVDLPPFFGNHGGYYARVPPPTSVVADSILPPPLSQRILGRCLAHKSKLVPFFALRLLAVALEKLRQALRMHDEAAHRYPLERLWRDSARRLVDELCRRCPPVKDVIGAYRAGKDTKDDDDLLFREAASRVLRLYYETTPQVALLARFDVSASLFAVLRQVGEHQSAPPDKVLKMMELENLLAIAGYSPGMRWFSKAEGLALSPFVALLKVYTEAPADLALNRVRDILDAVAQEQELVLSAAVPPPEEQQQQQQQQHRRGLAALFFSLQHTPAKGGSPLSEPVWSFVDNCAVRCASAPIRYIEMVQDLEKEVEEAATGSKTDSAVDPITMTMAEQMRFATASADDKTLKSLAAFVLRYCESCSGDESLLKPIFARMASAFPQDSRAAVKLAKGLPKRSRKGGPESAGSTTPEETAEEAEGDGGDDDEFAGVDGKEATDSLEVLLDMPPVRALDSAALSRWASKTADELVEEGFAAAVIILLASEQASVRREALVNLAKMAAKMRASTYDEKEQVWLLLAELVESAKAWMLDAETADLPLPTPALSFACHALDVLRNPLHCLYAKVNTFLTAGPVWRLAGGSGHGSGGAWPPLVHDVVQSGPSQDNAYYAELNWLLAYLLDSLRTPADVQVFRTRRLFEAVLSVAANSYLRVPLRRQVLRILCRAAAIDGGSVTLVTRSGIVSWLIARKAAAAAAAADTADDGRPQKPSRPRTRPGRSRMTRGADGEVPAESAEARTIQALLQKLWDTCDQERVDSWSKHGVQESIVLSGKA